MARGSGEICLPEAKRHETKPDCIPVEKGVGSESRKQSGTRSLGNSVSRGLRRDWQSGDKRYDQFSTL